MKLEGSCHCQKVKFSLESNEPVPFARCYCSICRKTAGGGGYAINLGGDYNTFHVEGEENVSAYQAMRIDSKTGEQKQSPMKRHFCSNCGSQLWAWDPRWPELVHPHASAIDTPLPVPPEHVHLMLGSKASWVVPQVEAYDKTYDEYPEESLAQWHQRVRSEGKL